MRAPILSVVSVVAIVAALAMAPAVASDEFRAKNVVEVGFVPISGTTHLEFLTRTFDAQTRHYALVGSRGLAGLPGEAGGGLNFIDITDPDAPVFAANIPCITDNIDIAVVPVTHTIEGVTYDTIIAIGSNSGAGCIFNGKRSGGVSFIGLRADAALAPEWLGSPNVGPDGKRFTAWKSPAAHTVVAHPSAPVVYSGNQALADRRPTVEVTDLAVWPPVTTPIALAIPNGSGPHDITFSPDGKRAYASSITMSFVWDTTDPRNPVTIGALDSANLKIHHEATLHPNGRHLLVVDEFIATSGENVGQCPGGGVHIFDLGPALPGGGNQFEAAPVPVAQFYTEDLSTPGINTGEVRTDISCTAHEFNIPAGGRWMPLGWFGAGVRVLDLRQLVINAAAPAPVPVPVSEIGYHVPLGTDVWAAKTHPSAPGYIFVSDTADGFRVLKYTARLP